MRGVVLWQRIRRCNLRQRRVCVRARTVVASITVIITIFFFCSRYYKRVLSECTIRYLSGRPTTNARVTVTKTHVQPADQHHETPMRIAQPNETHNRRADNVSTVSGCDNYHNNSVVRQIVYVQKCAARLRRYDDNTGGRSRPTATRNRQGRRATGPCVVISVIGKPLLSSRQVVTTVTEQIKFLLFCATEYKIYIYMYLFHLFCIVTAPPDLGFSYLIRYRTKRLGKVSVTITILTTFAECSTRVFVFVYSYFVKFALLNDEFF